MKKITKKGQVGNIQGFIMSIIGVAVVLAIGLIVLAELQSTTIDGSAGCTTTNTTACGEAYTATGSIITKMATIPTWIGILITVALAFIVLGYFYNRG